MHGQNQAGTSEGRPLEIAIIGAGMSGLFLGHRLLEAGRPFTIYEKASEVGGTWRENTYPGLHVDVITRSYEFPFARSAKWSRRYAPGSEIRSYLQGVATDTGLLKHIEFGIEITSAVFEDDRWTLTSTSGAARRVDVVFAGTGFLHRPVIPTIEGRDSFTGPAFHSAQWDHSVELRGKRIGVIGTGSSGLQIVSELGKTGHDVTHFTRTPQWIQVKANPRITSVERVLLGFPSLRRFWDWRMQKLKIKTDGSENWRLRPGPEREQMTQRFLAAMEKEVKDPKLRAQLTPDYQLGCKRIPKSPDYYRVIQQANVHPVFGRISRMTTEGIVDGAGILHPLDVVVFATGFDSHAYMRPMELVGANGVSLEDLWRESVFSYRGVALPSMPNFFLLSGPFAPVNSLAIPGSLADETGYLFKLLEVIDSQRVALAPRADVTQKFCDELGEAAALTTYMQCDNWYRDRGGVPVLWPWTKAQHGEQFKSLDIAEYDQYPLADSSMGAPGGLA